MPSFAMQTISPMTIGSRTFHFENGPFIVGVVNLSPESPNKDAVVGGAADAVARARALAADGTAIVDIGGRSSHFAAPLVSPAEERRRLLPALRGLKAAGFFVSVDSWDATVIRAAAASGADVINDSDGFQDPAVMDAIAESHLPVIIPIINGPDPRRMAPIDMTDPVGFMLRWLEQAIERASRAGVRDIILDPGTGYAQSHLSTEQKEALQRRVYPELGRFRALGYPIFVALPRKARLETTFELAELIVSAGADFVRAHDARLARQAINAVRGRHG